MVKTGHFKVEIYFYPVFLYSSYDVLHLGFLTAAPLLHALLRWSPELIPVPPLYKNVPVCYCIVLQTPPFLLLFSTREKVYYIQFFFLKRNMMVFLKNINEV